MSSPLLAGLQPDPPYEEGSTHEVPESLSRQPAFKNNRAEIVQDGPPLHEF